MSSIRYSCQMLMELAFLYKFFAKYPNIKFRDVTVFLNLPDCQLQYFANSSVDTNASHVI